MSLKLKGKVYMTCARSAMVYRGETWAVNAENSAMDVWCMSDG